ncbi:RNA pseudouridylate synthase domain-containing protein 1 isoform X1 [Mauremys reevesii]|uniref:RNA pseudouridylate synthase domain-containing protein 1 isoform X1 n=1 Tax=Mauremys reevesii TaxID=260615 RepID=UPI0019400257|nr:RNA pseudouridylate synthase domain-containing protein 1 isoform X1 [Mauremys reevesii]XP_039349101.1 RNA pseudouridylate synthase domain-containing protein 1 isoform X1 [Mauremys reevesii]
MEPGSIDNLSILYQSSDFIVVNKHWDVRIDSKMWYEKLTLQSQLKYRFPELADPDTYYGFRFCHQLDFSTSGALCVALNKAAAGSAYKCFKERMVTKAYLALVSGPTLVSLTLPSRGCGIAPSRAAFPDEGSQKAKTDAEVDPSSILANQSLTRLRVSCLELMELLVSAAVCAVQVRGHVSESRMTIRYAIGKNTTEGMTHMMCIEGTEGCENPKPCQSELSVLEHGSYSGDPVTKVLLQPLTGRTHQLRVHCSAAGHPIVGDFTYSFKKDSNPYRMMLHAYYLRIPTRKELIEVNAPDPFLTSLDSNWVPHRVVHRLDEMIQELKDKTIRAEEEERNQEALLSSGGEEMGSKAKTLEREEERAKCEQWLAEWALA